MNYRHIIPAIAIAFATLISLCTPFAFGQLQTAPPIQWQKSLGGNDSDYAFSVQQTLDGGYIVAGCSQSNDGDAVGNAGGMNYWVVKLASSGAMQWQKSFGDGYSVAYAIQQTSDGGYVVAGNSFGKGGAVTGNHGQLDYWIVKLDASGAIQWQKSLGGTSGDYAQSVHQTTDGGYIVAGGSRSIDGDVTAYHGGYWVVKLNSTGVMQWEKSLGGSGGDWAQSIQQTSDGGYVVAGVSASTDGDVTGNHGGSDFWIVKLSSSGALQWEKSLGGSGQDEAATIQQTPDGGYVVAGSSTSNDQDVTGNHGGYDCWVVKLDASGNIQWQKSLGGSGDEGATSVHLTSDGGYIVAGFSSSNDGDVTGNHGSQDYWVVKLNPSGAMQWEKSMGAGGADDATSIEQTTDGGYIVAGYAGANGGDITGNHNGTDFWVVKLGPVSPIISSAGSLTFAPLLCDSIATESIWVHNTGISNLLLTSASFLGANAAEFSLMQPTAFPIILAPGDSVRFIIRLSTSLIGQHVATLTIANNDLAFGHNPWNVAVTARKDIADFSLVPLALLFGDACPGTPSCLSLTAQNIGSVEDTITSVTLLAGSGAFAITAPTSPAPFGVGASALVTVCFTPPDTGTFTATFIAHSEPCGRSHAFTVTGRGRQGTLSPLSPQADLGDVAGGSCFDTTLGFVLSGNIAVDVTGATVAPTNAPLTITSSTPPLPHRFQAGDTMWLTVHYCPACDSVLAARLNISATALCVVSSTMNIIGHGSCSSLALNRRSITFGAALCNTGDTLETIVLSNRGTQSLDGNCKLIGPNAPDFALDLPTTFTIAPNGKRSVTVHFKATTRGVHTATLIITSNDPAHPADTLIVIAQVDATGLAVAARSVDFGDLPSCRIPTDTTFVLWNTGTVVDTVNASPTVNFKIVSALPRIIPPGKFDTIVVRFDPTISDINVAEDVLFKSMPCNISDTVHLKGKADTYTFVPNTIDFGNTQVGDTVCLNVSFVNHNAQPVQVRNMIVVPVGEIITQWPGLPFTIAAHDSIMFTLCYVPQDTTSMLAYVRAYVDAPCADTIISTLIGHGINSDITIAPRLIDFGELDLCTMKLDSVQICNRGATSITFASLTLGGADAVAFALVNAPSPPFTLIPGACQWIVVRCDTGLRNEGTWRAVLNIVPQGNSLPLQTVNLQVVRHASVLAVPAVVDFGKVNVGTWSDTTIVLHNNGTLPLCIDAITSATEFAIATKVLPVTLSPGDSLVLNIRFTPATDSLYRIDMVGHISCPCPEVKLISLFGNGVSNPLCTATATLVLDSIGARVGDVVDIPLHLAAQSNIAMCGATDFTYTIRYRGSLLAAMPPLGHDSAEWHVIGPITGTRTDTTGALGMLRFTATLGDTDATPIIMESFAWTNGVVATSVVNGQLHILNICPAGGKRLVNAAGTFALAQNAPNPFTGETAFEFETIERGRTRLYVDDVLGRSVAVVVDDDLTPGRYRKTVNMQSLPSGVYRAVLESAAMRTSVTMVKDR